MVLSQMPTYALVNVHALPMIDASRSIKSALCGAQRVPRINALIIASANAVNALFVVSLPFDVAMFFVSDTVGSWCAVVRVALQLPLLIVTLVTLRIDVLQCLLRTYEFWFLSILNAATCAMYCAYFRDARATAMAFFSFGVFLNIVVDANLLSRQLVVTSFLYIPYQFMLLVAVTLQLTPDTHSVTLLQYKGRAVSSNDFLANALSIILVLTLRTAYRKRQFLKRRATAVTAKNAQVACFVMYRCRVKLQLIDPIATTTAMTDELRTGSAPLRAQPLRYSSNHAVFVENDVVSPWMFERLRDPSDRARKQRIVALYTTGVCGLVFSLFPFVSRTYSFAGNRVTALAAFALACTLSFLSVFASCYNRKLLRELVLSFDFAALSLQLSIVHVCACDVFAYDARCYFVLFSWLAMHWVLTLDALTPAMRRSLGLNVRLVIPVVVFFVLAIVHVSLDMTVLKPTRPFQDRLLWSFEVWGRRAEFYVGPFILNRGWTLLLWCFRVLWRLCTSGEDDRIIIQGSVELVRHHRVAGSDDSRQSPSATHVSNRSTVAALPNVLKMNSVVPLTSTRVIPFGSHTESAT